MRSLPFPNFLMSEFIDAFRSCRNSNRRGSASSALMYRERSLATSCKSKRISAYFSVMSSRAASLPLIPSRFFRAEISCVRRFCSSPLRNSSALAAPIRISSTESRRDISFSISVSSPESGLTLLMASANSLSVSNSLSRSFSASLRSLTWRARFFTSRYFS